MRTTVREFTTFGPLRTGVIVFVSMFVLSASPHAQARQDQECGPVTTTRGAVSGSLVGNSCVFEGIPYAQPPVGALRWRPPIEHDRWDGVLETTAFGARCPQLDATGSVIGDEDCLHLNLWAPALNNGSLLPVMVWFHGGSHVKGAAQGASPPFDGQYFLEQFGMMVVTIDYRLNVLGYLAHPALDVESEQNVSGNYGLLDDIAALKWIQDNIAAFGGDPNRVMIDGVSAGAYDIALLVASPLSTGLFATAVAETVSPPLDTVPTLEQAEQTTGAQVADATGCWDAPDVGACLRALPTDAVVMAVPGLSGGWATDDYSPNIDGYVLPDAPLKLIGAGLHNQVPLVIGSNAEEVNLGFPLGSIPDDATYRSKIYEYFGQEGGELVLAQYPSTSYPTPEQAYVTVITDNLLTCPTRTVARVVASAQTEPVFRYFFTHTLGPTTPFSQRHAYHTQESLFVWHNFVSLTGYEPSDAEWALSDAIDTYWSRFAVAGDPNGPESVAWPVYQFARDPYLQLDDQLIGGEGVRTANCDFWDSHPELRLTQFP